MSTLIFCLSVNPLSIVSNSFCIFSLVSGLYSESNLTIAHDEVQEMDRDGRAKRQRFRGQTQEGHVCTEYSSPEDDEDDDGKDGGVGLTVPGGFC